MFLHVFFVEVFYQCRLKYPKLDENPFPLSDKYTLDL